MGNNDQVFDPHEFHYNSVCNNFGKMEAADVKHHRPEKLKMLFFRACKVGDLKALSTCLRTGLITVDELDAVSFLCIDCRCGVGWSWARVDWSGCEHM